MALLAPAADAAPADWLVASLTDFAVSVTSLVPRGFEAYVRVFHPAYRGPDDARITWAEIAAATGRVAHPGMQLAALIGFEPHSSHALPGVYDTSPQIGTLPASSAAALLPVLGQHTTTPARCWFAVWHGWGVLRPDIEQAPTFPLPSREYYLVEAPLAAATESIDDWRDPTGEWRQLANLWWPDDHAWCVASEIDLDSTYVGCSAACRDALLALPAIEALEIDPSCGITIASDNVNPPPSR